VYLPLNTGFRRISYRSMSAAGACAQQQTHCTPLLSIDGTGGQTTDRYIDPALLCVNDKVPITQASSNYKLCESA